MLQLQTQKLEEGLLGIIMGCDEMSVKLENLGGLEARVENGEREREALMEKFSAAEGGAPRVDELCQRIEQMERDREVQLQKIAELEATVRVPRLDELRKRVERVEREREAPTQPFAETERIENIEREKEVQAQLISALEAKLERLGSLQLRVETGEREREAQEQKLLELEAKFELQSCAASDHASTYATMDLGRSANGEPPVKLGSRPLVDDVHQRLSALEAKLLPLLETAREHASVFQGLKGSVQVPMEARALTLSINSTRAVEDACSPMSPSSQTRLPPPTLMPGQPMLLPGPAPSAAGPVALGSPRLGSGIAGVASPKAGSASRIPTVAASQTLFTWAAVPPGPAACMAGTLNRHSSAPTLLGTAPWTGSAQAGTARLDLQVAGAPNASFLQAAHPVSSPCASTPLQASSQLRSWAT